MAGSPGDGEGSLPPPNPEVANASPTFLDALALAIRAAYGDRLSDEELCAVLNKVTLTRNLAATLQQYPLQNGDEPDFIFAAFRREG